MKSAKYLSDQVEELRPCSLLAIYALRETNFGHWEARSAIHTAWGERLAQPGSMVYKVSSLQDDRETLVQILRG